MKIRNFSIPFGKYRGWQTRWYPFQERKWHATKHMELILEKTNMKLLELIDLRESEEWNAT